MRGSKHPRALQQMLSAFVLSGCVAHAVAAQGTANAGPSAGTGGYFESYSFNNPGAAGLKRVSLLTVPLTADMMLTRWMRFGIRSAFAAGELERSDGTHSTISGLTDTALEFSVPLVQDRVAIAASLVLPVGKSTYSEEEAQVAGIVAADLLPFRLTHWASGGSLDVSAQAAGTVGRMNVGARVGYQMGREFELLKAGSFSYRPGTQLYGRVGADVDVGAARLAGQVTVYTFGDDQLNSQNLFRTGNRVQGLLTYSIPAGAGRLQASVGALRRAHGTFADGSAVTPAQTLLFMASGLRQPFRFGALIPQADVRLVSSSDGLSQGYVGGAGMSAELTVSRNATFLPLFRARFGQLKVSDGVESGISGYEFGAGLRFGSAR